MQVGTFGVRRIADMHKDRYLAAVENVISRIDHGRFYQLNPPYPLACSGEQHRTGGIRAAVLINCNPPSAALVTGPRSGRHRQMITSFSPELFLRIRDCTVLTAPIKGTAPRRARRRWRSGTARFRARTRPRTS